MGLVPRYERFRVAGIFNSGFYQYDSAYAFMRLADAQHLFSEPDLVSVLSFRLDDLYLAPDVAKELEEYAGPGYQATTWIDQNRELFRALKLEQVVTFIILALIVVIAALNILIALTMMVMEKSRDIAVLMSFGVSSAQVRRIFLLRGSAHLGHRQRARTHPRLHRKPCSERTIASFALDPSVYSISYLPFAPSISDGLIVLAVSLGLSLLATLYPSHSAASILPAEALRYE